MNTMLMPKDYEYLLNDSRARVLVVDASLLDRIDADPRRVSGIWSTCSWPAATRPGYCASGAT